MYLTITKKYFDLIASGEKKVEYRKAIPYYDKKFAKEPKEIIFHYRRPIYLICQIEKIERIKRLETLEKSKFVTTPYCYAIHIASCRVQSGK
jgi:ASC-1-like (ASCH) protein